MNQEKTLIGWSKREDHPKFIVALRKAKEDVDGAKAYARLNPVCSRCEKSQLKGGYVQCIKMPDGIRCCRCRTMKQGCPRVVDFWITHVARQLGRPEAYVRDLYTLNTARRSEKTRGSTKEDEDSYVESGEDEASTVDDQEKIQFLPPSPKPNSSTSDPEVPLTPNDIELKQEIELLTNRAEIAEGNFVALVGRVQDFRTSLRSEIHTMPPATEAIDGLSRLSAAMQTTIDDSGLYMRDIPDALKQSRFKWEIQYGTQAEVVKPKGGSKETRRQIRQRSPELDENIQKRRKI